MDKSYLIPFGDKRALPIYSHGRLIDVDGTEYPDSDGQPISDNTLQWNWIATIKENLEALFAERDDVFVAGDLLWYPVRGKPTERRAPDTMVAFGRPKGYRGSYLQWLEDNIAPQVVFEILSPGNQTAEMRDKLAFYEKHGVEEYYLYEPYLPELTIFNRDTTGALAMILPVNGYVSPRLGVRFEIGNGEPLRLFTPDGEPFRTFVENNRERTEALRERDAVAQERDAATARAERLAARLRELGVEE